MKDDPQYRIGYGLFVVSDKRFEAAARVHDHAYRNGSDSQWSGMTRKEIDDRFFRYDANRR